MTGYGKIKVSSPSMDTTRQKACTVEEGKKAIEDVFKNEEGIAELGEKFEKDKAKLEDAIDRLNSSNVAEDDKRSLMKECNSAIEILQEKYEKEVKEEREKCFVVVQENIDMMDSMANEFGEQENELKKLELDIPNQAASAAADLVSEKKKAFETARDEYLQELNLRMEQSKMQEKNMRIRRLSGQ